MSQHGFKLAAWRIGYKREWLITDLLAGVSVAAVAIPVAMAYSQLAGVPPVYGLYASLLPLLAYALLGSSRQLIVAPDAATCALVVAIVAPLAVGEPARYLALTAALAMIAGVFCIAAGFARLGFLTNFLARPILTGYLNGIAVSIIIGQLGSLFGFRVESGGFFRMAWRFIQQLEQTHLPTLAIGAGMLALLLLLARVAPKVPGPLVAMLVGIAGSAALDVSAFGVRLLGEIPAGLPALQLPSLLASDWQPLAMGAIGLALISYNSAMVTARGFAAKNRYDINPNQEFIALGVANIGAGALQGFAVSGADSRTAVNDSVGGKSQVVGIVAAVVIALTLMFFTEPLGWLPVAVLSAVLVKAALGLFDLRGMLDLRRVSPREFRLSLFTFLGVITLGVLPGVVLAVGAAIVQLLFKASVPHDAVLGRMPRTQIYVDKTTHSQAESFAGIVVYRFDSALVFFNADHFKARARAVVQQAAQPVRTFVLDAETMPYMDTTGAASLEYVCAEFKARGMVVAIAAAKGPVREMLERTGLLECIGANRLYASVNDAVEAFTTTGE